MKNYKTKNGNINLKILQELIDELSHESIMTGGTDRKITEELDRLYRIRNRERKSQGKKFLNS